MFLQKTSLAVLLLVAAGLCGCPGEPAVSTAIGQPDIGSSERHRPQQRAGRERPAGRRNGVLSLSVYQNTGQGVGLLFPRNYALEEGNILEHSYFLRRQEELDVEKPGATLVATILIPEDAYPNTAFEHGSLQLITEDAWTRKACRQTEALGEGESRRLKGMTVEGISFEGQENQSITGGALVAERDYTGFQNGTCYEFLLVVALQGASEDIDPADTAKIMKQLEKIASSLAISPKPRVPEIRASAEGSRRL